jgi:hypothetical protein
MSYLLPAEAMLVLPLSIAFELHLPMMTILILLPGLRLHLLSFNQMSHKHLSSS